jgi:hypothetical protein
MTDTLYYHGDGVEDYLTGEAIICFFYREGTPAKGWSRRLNDFKTRGWEWEQSKGYKGKAIGHRCLIQW